MAACGETFPGVENDAELGNYSNGGNLPSWLPLLPAVINSTNVTYSNISPTALPSRPALEYQQVYEVIFFALDTVSMPLVFTIGIVGNIMNLIVLGQKRFRRGLNHIERSALTGLIFLAVSDFLFCLVGLPGTLLSTKSPSVLKGTVAGLYYGIYRAGLFNLFLFTSTWMTVSISLERYIALVHPFTARWLIRIDRSVSAHVSIVVFSFTLNLPLFFKHKIVNTPCLVDGQCLTCHYPLPTQFYLEHKALFHAHTILWAVVGTGVPFLLLVFANVRISFAVWSASRMIPTGNAADESKNTALTSRITMTLMAMIVTFLFLVGPSMVLTFLTSVSAVSSEQQTHFAYMVAVLVTNFCQAVKLATNFLLYCVTNKQFRDSVQGAVCRTSQGKPSMVTTKKYKLVELPNT